MNKFEGALAHAFVKSGLVSQETVDTHNESVDERQEQEDENKRQQKKQRAIDAQKVSKELDEAFKPFQELYAGEKSKKFLIHLIFAFIKEDNNSIVTDWNKEHKRKHCAACGRNVISFRQLCEKIGKDKADLMSAINVSLSKSDLNIFKDKVEGIRNRRRLAISSKESSRFMCNPCFEILKAWLTQKMLSGDKMLSRIIGELSGNPFIKNKRRSKGR